MSSRKTLFSTQTSSANGTATVINFMNDEQDLYAYGTWDGATIKLQRLAPNGTTWIDERDLTRTVISITADETIPLSLPYGATVRGVVSGAGASTSLNLVIQQRGRSGN